MVEQNKQYGHLIVLYPEDINEGSHPRKMWTCKCACGNVILLTEFEILNEHCQRACLDSRGEICAADFFDELNIEYQAMKRFDDFEYAFDFYLPAYNIAIECDGAQHFRTKNSEWMSQFKLQEMRDRDDAKTKYCKEYGILLYRISFWDHSKFEELRERFSWN